MTRKEEILGYCGESNYKPFSVEACTAIKAIEWADQHPRKGLVDIDKVIEWLDKYADSYTYYNVDKNETEFIGQMFDDLRKSMED